MRLTLLTFLVAFQIGPVSTGAAQENQKLREHEMAIQNFSFQGMPFGTSGTEFLRRIPSAEFDGKQSDQQKKLHVLLIEDVPGTDHVEASFIDEKLYEISFYYLPTTLNKQGGWKAVSEKVASEFGEADVSEVGRDSAVIASLSWNFLAVERFIGITVLERSVKVTFSDTSGYSKMTDRIGREGAERHQIEEEKAVEIEQRRIEADGRRLSLAEREVLEKEIEVIKLENRTLHRSLDGISIVGLFGSDQLRANIAKHDSIWAQIHANDRLLTAKIQLLYSIHLRK